MPGIVINLLRIVTDNVESSPTRNKITILFQQTLYGIILVVAWRSGNVVWRINEVALRRARLVLGWVTVLGRQTTSVFHQATQANSASYPQRDRK